MIPQNLGYIFDHALGLTPARLALLSAAGSLTFAELDTRCNKVASMLRNLGIIPDDHIALLFGNDLHFPEVLFGCMRARATPAPLNPKLPIDSLAYVLTDSDAKILIVGGGFESRAHELAARVPSLKHVILQSGATAPWLSYADLMASCSPNFERENTKPDDVCLLLYTSGTSGSPKGTLLTHGGQIWNADVLRKAELLDFSERALVTVPLFHKAGLATTKSFLLAGGSVVILPAFDPVEVIRAIEHWQVTYMPGVPAMYRRILAEKALLERHNVSSLRHAACGSAAVPVDLCEEFHRVFHVRLTEIYGLTEGGPVPLINSRGKPTKPGSCGRTVENCKAKLVADDGVTEVLPGQVGELVLRNPGVAKAYWKLSETTELKLRDGWLYTGDLMRCDEDGFFFFVGRKDDTINVAGEKVHPQHIESLLLKHPNVKEVCVVRARDSLKGEVPVAFICERRCGAASEKEIKEFCIQNGAAFAHPRWVVFVESLPISTTGKVDRSYLIRHAEEITAIPELGEGTDAF